MLLQSPNNLKEKPDKAPDKAPKPTFPPLSENASLKERRGKLLGRGVFSPVY